MDNKKLIIKYVDLLLCDIVMLILSIYVMLKYDFIYMNVGIVVSGCSALEMISLIRTAYKERKKGIKDNIKISDC